MTDGHSPEKRRPDKAAFFIAAALFIIAAVIAWDANGLSGAVSRYSGIGAATVPYFVAAIIALLGVGTVRAALKGDFPEREIIEFPPVIWISAGLIGQILLLKTAGFSLATGWLFAATTRGFGYRALWISFPAGVAISFLLYLAFTRGLELTLPAGILEHLL